VFGRPRVRASKRRLRSRFPMLAIAEFESAHARIRPEPELAAEQAGLRYVSADDPGITRVRSGRGWTYRDPTGATIRERAVRRRIEALVIPPAWKDVWICADPDGHLQATGRDERGRKQYRYHRRFREAQDSSKFSRLPMFGLSLTRIRARVEEDLAHAGLPRARVLAAAVRILDRHPIRVGNERYAKANDSYGLTTMRDRHVEVVEGGEIRFRFRGKSGKENRVGIYDDELARVIEDCSELEGAELFKYVDEAGVTRTLESDDVNEFLRRVTGYDLTAKDFRTWTGTVRAVTVLDELGYTPNVRERKKRLVQAVKFVAADLHNTPATCRAFYIHPAVLASYEEGTLEALLDEADGDGGSYPESAEGLSPEERRVMALLPLLEAATGD
jgi:DNA topoisomerase-1